MSFRWSPGPPQSSPHAVEKHLFWDLECLLTLILWPCSPCSSLLLCLYGVLAAFKFHRGTTNLTDVLCFGLLWFCCRASCNLPCNSGQVLTSLHRWHPCSPLQLPRPCCLNLICRGIRSEVSDLSILGYFRHVPQVLEKE